MGKLFKKYFFVICYDGSSLHSGLLGELVSVPAKVELHPGQVPSLSQGRIGRKTGTRTHTHTKGQFRVTESHQLHVAGLQEEATGRKNNQSPH